MRPGCVVEITEDNYDDKCRRCGHSRSNHGEVGHVRTDIPYNDDGIIPGTCFCGCSRFVE